jgi:hypothetical protein
MDDEREAKKVTGIPRGSYLERGNVGKVVCR